jgi:hypothetical protein
MTPENSPIPKVSQRTPYAPWRRFEPAVLKELLDTVAAVNGQLLDALVDSARSDNLEFPLPESLRGPVARLTVPERETIARCGVFLGDVNLWGISPGRGIADQSGMALSIESGRPWLPTEQSLSLAHSMLLLSWYLIHVSPAVARVGPARRMDSPGGGRGRRGEPGSSIDDAAVSAGERGKFRRAVRPPGALGMTRRGWVASQRCHTSTVRRGVALRRPGDRAP